MVKSAQYQHCVQSIDYFVKTKKKSSESKNIFLKTVTLKQQFKNYIIVNIIKCVILNDT